jgi:hypothetical protein
MRLGLAVLFGLTVTLVALGQHGDEDGARLLWDTGLLQKRPASKGGVSARVSRPALKYRPVSAATTAAATNIAPARPDDAILGITFWRLRPSVTADDPNSRLLVLDEGASGEVEYTPERIEADSPLNAGDRVRLTIEVPRTGFLYVIDREQYADGTFGPAYLIYPNWQTRQGDNAVAAGRLIEIPDQRDRPNHFRVRRSRPDQTSELLNVFVTPKPLEGIRIQKPAAQISDAQLAEWEKSYGVAAERFELEGGAGKAWTPAEKNAAATAGLLTRDDAAPQTLYRVQARPGEALLLKLPIRIKK